MKCATCEKEGAAGIIDLTENIHERLCAECVEAWTQDYLIAGRLTAGDGAGALRLFRAFQSERAPQANP